MAKEQDPKKKKGLNDGANRGTQDELEILGLIVTQNIGVRTQVFERLRQAKKRHEARVGARAKAAGEGDEKAS